MRESVLEGLRQLGSKVWDEESVLDDVYEFEDPDDWELSVADLECENGEMYVERGLLRLSLKLRWVEEVVDDVVMEFGVVGRRRGVSISISILGCFERRFVYFVGRNEEKDSKRILSNFRIRKRKKRIGICDAPGNRCNIQNVRLIALCQRSH